MAKRTCRNRNKKTGRFQKVKTSNTKRVCYTAKGKGKAKGKGSRKGKPCRSKRTGRFTRCR